MLHASREYRQHQECRPKTGRHRGTLSRLERWDEAVLAIKDFRRTGAVKVLLEPAPQSP
jgi:hypothetical protein